MDPDMKTQVMEVEIETPEKKVEKQQRERTYAVALHEAQRLIGFVGKDSTNSHNRYKYTSAEHMIDSCRGILHDCGLVLEPTEVLHTIHECTRVVGDSLETVQQMIVGCGFRATEIISGENREYVIEVPVSDRKGTPYDKASLASQTTALNYLLRNLLLVPRVDEEVCAREDVADQKVTHDKDRDAAIEAVQKEMQQLGAVWAEEVFGHYNCEDAKDLTNEQLKIVLDRAKVKKQQFIDEAKED